MIESQSRTIEINLAEEAEEYGALERSKIVTAHVAVRSNQIFLVNSSIRSATPITGGKQIGSLVHRVSRGSCGHTLNQVRNPWEAQFSAMHAAIQGKASPCSLR